MGRSVSVVGFGLLCILLLTSEGAERTKMSPSSSHVGPFRRPELSNLFLRLTHRANEMIYHVYKSNLKSKS